MSQAPLYLYEDESAYLDDDDRATRPLNRSRRLDAENLPSILSIDEMADALRVNRKTLYEAFRKGEIPGARRIGRIIRVDRDTVLDWLSGRSGVSRKPSGGQR
jgi:excisionase family DNA binding protein